MAIKLPENLDGNIYAIELFIILHIWRNDDVFMYGQMVEYIKSKLREKNVNEFFVESSKCESIIHETLDEMVERNVLETFDGSIYFPNNHRSVHKFDTNPK